VVDAVIGQVYGGRYFIEGKLGTGAMGTVYRARHTKLAARAFAIKVLHRQLVTDPKLRKRFEREAELASGLSHPNLVGVVDVGEAPDGSLYLVMELADGPPLSSLVGKPMPAARVLNFARQLCAGLEHAHAAGLIHRDFKPENVIVERGPDGQERLRIVDFGIAMMAGGHDERERLTTAGVVIGTPHYMAPEHASGQAVDHRIDLFALGVICFEMLCGKMPFDGDGVEVARANINDDAPTMAQRTPNVDVDPLLEAMTRKLLSRDAARRPQSAKAADELFALIDRDRGAAAAALGVTRARAVPATVASPPSTAPRPAVSMAPLTRTRPASRADTALKTRRIRHRGMLAGLAALAIGAVLALALVVGLREGEVTRASSSPRPALATTPPLAPASPPASPTSQITATPLPIPSAAPPSPPPPPPPLAPPGPAPVPVLVPVESPPRLASDPTSALVAEHYAAVGRALTRLQARRGTDATFDLWPRFRFIRIQQAIATLEQRLEATRLLDALDRDIAARDLAARDGR
jgi:eukaryotic-like serine/threonine-protein kinase